MIRLQADQVALRVIQGQLLTSGARNLYECRFSFSEEWDGVDRTAVFQAGHTRIHVALDGSDSCMVPWEVLEKPWVPLYAGVYGTQGGELVMPTVMVRLGDIRGGASLGDEGAEATPGIYDQVLAIANGAQAQVQALRDEAEAGSFTGAPGPAGQDGADGKDGADGRDGVTPVRGTDYWTQEDQEQIVAQVLAALPMGDEVSY